MKEYNVKTRVVGVDISIDRTSYAIVDIRGHIYALDNFKSSDYPDINNYVTELSERILAQAEANGGYETIRSIGISAPNASGITGCIENPSNLPWKGMIPLAAMLRDRIGLAVGLANDAHVSALGEQAFGCAHGMKEFIVVHIGNGLGSCFFTEGHEHRGYAGIAGEFGHTILKMGGRRCACGKQGCLEAYVASKGIVLTAQEVMAESSEPSLMREIETLTPQIISELCDKGDKLAIETLRRSGILFGIGLANYASVVNPEAIILTGGISHAGKWLLEPVYEAFEENIFPGMRDKVKLLTSKLKDQERDILGASVVAWEVPEYSLFK